VPIDTTQLAVPGLGVPGVTYPGRMPQIVPPFVERPMAPDRPEHRPFNRVKYRVAVTVLKDGFGNYRSLENPTEDDINNAAAAYLGGRDYEISVDEANALETAGYEVTPT
jgi:hypothetical protein